MTYHAYILLASNIINGSKPVERAVACMERCAWCGNGGEGGWKKKREKIARNLSAAKAMINELLCRAAQCRTATSVSFSRMDTRATASRANHVERRYNPTEPERTRSDRERRCLLLLPVATKLLDGQHTRTQSSLIRRPYRRQARISVQCI